MNKKRLRKEFECLRSKNAIKCNEMEKMAKLMGRIKSKRGKEPTWINEKYPDLRPLSIPHHGGSGDLNKFTAQSILDQLEGDLERIEEAE